ncbi:hypothetical protein FC48_GL001758 [Ligilactobacillus murinus DSM 20452 = NBRC 14221]|uniref:Resolvase HTH domain-containing protein n=1 Tax=Ligilactobacillus murinus DSM 20452 = NBRC 14221 TaxID=1423772 RepID=A0A0R2B257_9LACO|nr:hypothetical protein [Ligilactobacillus murinus]KRM70233.1 hypothetical protein FC48_GL001758 [Ligilactobacillus murinus DSM 20452 = NBRC 14221]
MGSEVDYKIVQGHYLLGGGQEANKYEFKIYRGHPDFEKITVDSVCWTFYQAEDILTPIPAIIRVQGVFSERNIVRVKLAKEQQRGYPILPIVKVIDDFDFELLEYMFAVHNRFQSDLSRLGYDGAAKDLDPRNLKRARIQREIHRLSHDGKGTRTIAEIMGISRNTVKKYLQLTTKEFLSETNNPLREYQRDILEHLYADHRVSIRHIYNELQEKYDNNIKVGYRQFARYVKNLREKHKIERN